jgi:hypothetical protein
LTENSSKALSTFPGLSCCICLERSFLAFPSPFLTADRENMAFPNPALIQALRDTALRLRDGAPYAWGHHGHCNCGNLAQTVVQVTPGVIQQYALDRAGEWTELAEAYCPTSGAPIDWLIQQLLALGLTPTDIHALEYLSDKAVLRALPGGFRWLRKNQRDDVVLYFETFAHLLEQQYYDRVLQRELQNAQLEEVVH